jgi:hypothetical protein
MSRPNTTEIEKETGDQVRLYVYSVPKKNHDAMLQICSQFIDIFTKHGCNATLMKLYLNLLSPGSSPIREEFSRLKV